MDVTHTKASAITDSSIVWELTNHYILGGKSVFRIKGKFCLKNRPVLNMRSNCNEYCNNILVMLSESYRAKWLKPTRLVPGR